MRRLLCLSLLALSVHSFGQSSFVVRPALGNPELTDGSGREKSSVAVGEVMRFTVPVYNNSFEQSVRAGSGRLEVDLGAVGAGVLEVVQAPLRGSFLWDKAVIRNGHSYISGRLVNNLGGSYAGSETFVLKATGPLSTRLRVRWIDTTPAAGKRPDIFTELQVKVSESR